MYLLKLNKLTETINENDELAGDLLIPFKDNYDGIDTIQKGGGKMYLINGVIKGPVLSIAMFENGNILATSIGHNVLLWEVNTDPAAQHKIIPKNFIGKGIHDDSSSLERPDLSNVHNSDVSCLAFGTHGNITLLASGDNSGNVKVWNVDNTYNVKYVTTLRIPVATGPITSIEFHPTESLLAVGHTGGEDGFMNIIRMSAPSGGDGITWTRRTGMMRSADGSPYSSVAFHPRDEILALVNSSGLDIWNLDSDDRGFFHSPDTTCVAFHPVLPILATGNKFGNIVLYEINTNPLPGVVRLERVVRSKALVNPSSVLCIEFCTSGRFLASGDANCTTTWELDPDAFTLTEIDRGGEGNTDGKGAIRSVVIREEQNILITGTDRGIMIEILAPNLKAAAAAAANPFLKLAKASGEPYTSAYVAASSTSPPHQPTVQLPPLQSGWVQMIDPEGRTYYFNQQLNKMQWDPPLADQAAPAAAPHKTAAELEEEAKRTDILYSSHDVKDGLAQREYEELISSYGGRRVSNRAPCWWHRINDYERQRIRRLKRSEPNHPRLVGLFYTQTQGQHSYMTTDGDERGDVVTVAMRAFASYYNGFYRLINGSLPPPEIAARQELMTPLLINAMRQRAARGALAGVNMRIPSAFMEDWRGLTYVEFASIFFYTSIEQPGNFSTYTMLRSSMQYSSVKDKTGVEYVEIIKHPIVSSLFIAMTKCPKAGRILDRGLLPTHPPPPPDKDRFLHRFIRVTEDAFNLYGSARPHSIVTFNCYQSFSLCLSENSITPFTSAPDPPREPPPTHLVLIRIVIKPNTSARYISHLSAVPSENEVLALPCIPYKITGNEVFWGERDEPAAAAAKFKEFIRSETGFAYGPEFHPWRSFMVITLEEQEYDVSTKNEYIHTLNG